MKKLIVFAAMLAFGYSTMAQDKDKQTTVVKNETKVKKTSSVPQKVHNTFSKKKHYNGKKVKHVKETETTTTEK